MATALVALSVAALLGEVAVRWLVPETAVFERLDRWDLHPRLGRVLRADHSFTAKGVRYEVNARHLRDRPFDPEPPPGTFRIAVVGDSFVYGIGPLDTIFPRVLEQRLRGTFGDHVEVMAVGMPGYGTVQQNDFLEEYLEGFRFDVVILAFCVGNDVTEVRRSISWEDDPDKRRVHKGPGLFGRLARVSRLVGALRDFARRHRGKDKYYESVERRMRLAYPARYEEPKWSGAYDRTVSEISRMRDFAASHGGTFAVFLLPDEYQFDETLRTTVFERFGTTAEGLVPRLLQRKLATDLPAAGIPTLDPFGGFAADFEPGRRYIPFDTHFDEEGNRIAAEHLVAWVTETFGRTIRERRSR